MLTAEHFLLQPIDLIFMQKILDLRKGDFQVFGDSFYAFGGTF
jgi:hypothetical protein